MPTRPGSCVVATFLLVTACGGGGGGNDNSKTLRLEAAFDRSGMVFGDGTYYLLPDCGGVLGVGDYQDNRAKRGFVSILLAPIPAGATIDSATLDLDGYPATGSPYGEFGAMVMDHMDVGAGFGGGDFSGGTLTATYRTLPTVTGTSVAPTPVSLDVKSALVADRAAGRPTSTFRLQFNLAPSPDLGTDDVYFTANTAVPLTLPHVTLTYH